MVLDMIEFLPEESKQLDVALELNPPGSGFNQITPRLLTVPSESAYTYAYIDVSSYMPVGSTGAILLCYGPGGWGSFNVFGSGRMAFRGQCWVVVAVDANRRFRFYGGGVQLWLVGYTGPNVVFLPETDPQYPRYGVQIGSVYNDWETVGLGPYTTPDTTGIICLVEAESGLELRGFGIQKHGSNDWKVGNIWAHSCYGAVIGCDEQQRIDLWRTYAQDSFGWWPVTVKMIGYIKGMPLNTNAVNISPPQLNQWAELPPAVGNYGMAIIQATAAAYDLYGLRIAGSSHEFYEHLQCMAWAIVGTGLFGGIEGKVNKSTTDFWLVGGSSK